MRPLGTAALLTVLAATAACGSGTGDRPADAAQGDRCAGRGTVVARADLDGDGTREPVRLTGAGGPCPHRLVAGSRSVDVAGLGLVAKRASVVRPGGQELVLVPAHSHPRGGSQPRLFTAGGRDGLTEVVTKAGDPVLPFVATDGGQPPTTATCRDGGIAVLTASAHQPPGVVLAWDVRRTSYRIEEGVAVRTEDAVVEKAVADPLLRKRLPALFDGSLFAGCSAGLSR